MTLPGAGESVHDNRVPVLYLAPWVDLGGSDKGTIDWFRWLDRDRFAPSLITTQPSPNRRIAEVYPYAEEVWVLPECMSGSEFPQFIFDFLSTRRIRLLHIMNSRLGYELLPDLGWLDQPPAVVVQLHVEEADCSGYVRYVTTRYGNLVDAFSVSSEHLASGMSKYDVTRRRIRVIPTGVDAAGEFNPARVTPHAFSGAPAVRILFAGRLVDQKDPLLMIEVIRRLVMQRGEVHVEVVGEGPIESELRRRCREYGLERHVTLHGPTADLAPWLAGTDLLLLTSEFEGVPYVAYEALAMGMPVVTPALPGTVELVGPGGGSLIDPRDDVDAYVEALIGLVDDAPRRRRLGADARSRMLADFSLRGMAAAHEQLYDELLDGRASAEGLHGAPGPEPMSFASRPLGGTPLVSIITPCFDHGHYLLDLMESVREQDYPALELILVDDGSSDPDTLAVLEDLEREPSVRVLRQPHNQGPSAARNRAIRAAAGRYILPLDADNVLMPGAVRGLVEQLQAAGEQVGFIYPTAQYFGNRDYHFRPPSYNLHRLLEGNYIDTCSLFDRDVFDAGLAFAEDIALGHEDWDLALALGARGVVGQPSQHSVLAYRKHGFTRSDRVEYLRLPFREEIQGRHAELFGHATDCGTLGRYAGPGLRLKAHWSPAITLIAAEPLDLESERGTELLRRVERQTCGDLEVIVETPRVPPWTPAVVRRLPPGLAATAVERVQEGLDSSRGRCLLIARALEELLGDPTLIERLLRTFITDPGLMSVAFTDVGETPGVFPSAIIGRLGSSPDAHAVAWRREVGQRLGVVDLSSDDVTGALARRIHRRETGTQWRHAPMQRRPTRTPSGAESVSGEQAAIDFRRGGPATAMAKSDALETDERLSATPAIPTMPGGHVPRWGGAGSWMPPETMPLVRHVRDDGCRIITNDPHSPPGCRYERNLGSIQRFSPPGTIRLVRRDGDYITVQRGSPRPDGDEVYGYLELAPLPLFIGIERVTLPDGRVTLGIANERDPIHSVAIERDFLGFIESLPAEPQHPPSRTACPGLVLIRRVDRVLRHHVYEAVDPTAEYRGGRPIAAELGRLLPLPEYGTVPVFISPEGFVTTDRYSLTWTRPEPQEIVRWVAAPMTWKRFGMVRGRVQSSARRVVDAVQLVRPQGPAVGGRPSRDGRPADRSWSGVSSEPRPIGYMASQPEEGMAAVYAARHPVLQDEFLTHHATEATDMGYVDVRLLGYVDAEAPLTGRTGSQRVGIPWASRFGLAARYSWDDRR